MISQTRRKIRLTLTIVSAPVRAFFEAHAQGLFSVYEAILTIGKRRGSAHCQWLQWGRFTP
jgi:hypothetical protein